MIMDPKERRTPPKKAVALRYVPPLDRAPKLTAKGSGLLAQKIIELAQKHGIPIKEDPVLIQVLSQLDFYQEIPPSIYVMVAEILAFVYSVNNRWRGGEDQRK
jgi:flagellar biosynthesis protein